MWGLAFPLDLQLFLPVCSPGFSMVTGTCRVNICSGRGNTEVTDSQMIRVTGSLWSHKMMNMSF